jgi:hypothetical protein
MLSAAFALEMSSPVSAQTKIEAYTGKEPLKIPPGDGGFVKTIPDLKVLFEGEILQ